MNGEIKYKITAFGEVLWDLLPDASVLGGAPFNFTYRINNIGNEGFIISAVGNDVLGEKALKTISNLQITDNYIQISPTFPTGIVNVFFDEHKNPDYEIIKDVAYDYVAYSHKLEKLIAEADCICFGTLAQRNPVSKQTLKKLLRHFKGKFRFYDLNLRKDCFTTENIIFSLQNCDILKLNKQEAFEINKLLGLNRTGLVEICTELINTYGIQYCVTTLEECGSIAFSSVGEIVYSPGYEIVMSDPLGAGDAFSAGFVDALLRGKSLTDASGTGNKLGALVATQTGATQKISDKDLQAISINCKRISDNNYLKYIQH